MQEEEILKQDRIESAHLASTSKDKGKKSKNNETLKTAAYILNQVPTKAAVKTPYDYELWTGREPILKHFHIWGFPAEARLYRLNEKKLDSKTVSSYFIGYYKRFKGYKFFDPTLRSIFETGTATFFLRMLSLGGDIRLKTLSLRRNQFRFPRSLLTMCRFLYLSLIKKQIWILNQTMLIKPIPEEQTQQPQESVPLRRSTRERRTVIPDDFIVFL